MKKKERMLTEEEMSDKDKKRELETGVRNHCYGNGALDHLLTSSLGAQWLRGA